MDSRVLAVLAALVVTPAAAQTAVDGDTIKLNGTTWRLWGIDAPEMKQVCGDWTAGVAAGYALADLMRASQGLAEARQRPSMGRIHRRPSDCVSRTV
jgi:endonuclease YncB( thermonuclease family)